MVQGTRPAIAAVRGRRRWGRRGCKPWPHTAGALRYSALVSGLGGEPAHLRAGQTPQWQACVQALRSTKFGNTSLASHRMAKRPPEVQGVPAWWRRAATSMLPRWSSPVATALLLVHGDKTRCHN